MTNTRAEQLNVRISAYLPHCIRRHLETSPTLDIPTTTSSQHRQQCVAMFADVSGFTAMTENLAAQGPVGAERLGKYLNAYLEQLIRLISSAGGDVFKFAGDAIIVLWLDQERPAPSGASQHSSSESSSSLTTLLRRATQCALRIQEHLHEATLAPQVTLSIKMGLGVGDIRFGHLGGESDSISSRVEYIALGPALMQAFQSEAQARPGQVICSSKIWKSISEFFRGTRHCQVANLQHEYIVIHALVSGLPMLNREYIQKNGENIQQNIQQQPLVDEIEVQRRMKCYVPRAVWPFVSAREESWGSELRDITVLFINLGLSELDLADMNISVLQQAFARVQKCVYGFQGTINKFLVDDKGSTVIAAFGLPPIAHEDDAVRGILASLAICAELRNLGPLNISLNPSVGITSGTAFCGVVGHSGNRREYTVLGDIVNLAARLMQRAKLEQGGVITDDMTKVLAQNVLLFESRPEILVKGKQRGIKIHRPYPRMSTIMMELKLKPKLYMEERLLSLRNVMENMYLVQLHRTHHEFSASNAQTTNSGYPVLKTNTSTRSDEEILAKILDSCLSPDDEASSSSTILIEGRSGLGKSRLLSNLTLALSTSANSNVLLFHDTAKAFGYALPSSDSSGYYRFWVDVLWQFQEQHPCDNNNWIQKTLEEGCYPGQAWRLNKILHTQFEAEAREGLELDSEWPKECPDAVGQWFLDQQQQQHSSEDCLEEPLVHHPNNNNNNNNDNDNQEEEEDSHEYIRASRPQQIQQQQQWSGLSERDRIGILILVLLRDMVLQHPNTVIVIDNAMELDAQSWILAMVIAQRFTKCHMIMATRPASKSRGHRSNVLAQMQALKCFPTTQTVVLQPLTPYHTQELAQRILEVDEIPHELASLLVSRSQGNPLFLLETISAMVECGEIQHDRASRRCVTRAQEAWKDKSLARCCFQCHVEFRNKKHRCKCCGFLFCETCTPTACRRKLSSRHLGTPGLGLGSYSGPSTTTKSSKSKSGQLDNEISSSTKERLVRHCVECYADKSHNNNASTNNALSKTTRHRLALRPPAGVKSILTSDLDSLSVSQRMILKTASVIGEVFELEVLRGAYPIADHLCRLERDLEILESQDLIRPCEPHLSNLTKCLTRKYEFHHGFVRDVIRSQMLSGQLDRLYQKVGEIRELHERNLRQAFIRRATLETEKQQHMLHTNNNNNNNHHLQLKTALVQVKKQTRSSSVFRTLRWKKRYATLQTSRLVLQADDPTSNPPLDKRTLLYLQGARVSAYPDASSSSSHRPGTFRLVVQKWKKGPGPVEMSEREVVISTGSTEQLEAWMYMIHFATESLAAKDSDNNNNTRKYCCSASSKAERKNAITPVVLMERQRQHHHLSSSSSSPPCLSPQVNES